MLIGVLIGSFSGLRGGRVDMVDHALRRHHDRHPVPDLDQLLVMLMLEPGMLSIILAFALTQWTEVARLVRGEVLRLEADRVRHRRPRPGRRPWRLLARHFFPNILPVIIVTVTFQVTWAIFGEAFLSYIGLGIQPPQTSWGKLVAGGITEMRDNPYLLIFPSIVISLTMLSLQLIGDGLRDATDPKLRR